MRRWIKHCVKFCVVTLALLLIAGCDGVIYSDGYSTLSTVPPAPRYFKCYAINLSTRRFFSGTSQHSNSAAISRALHRCRGRAYPGACRVAYNRPCETSVGARGVYVCRVTNRQTGRRFRNRSADPRLARRSARSQCLSGPYPGACSRASCQYR